MKTARFLVELVKKAKKKLILAVASYFTYNTLMEKGQEWLLQQAQVLLDRLERLSADSIWAHKASGLRGSLIRSMDDLSKGMIDQTQLDDLLRQGFEILNQAAQEIPENS